jgi:hypothetical protein
VSAITGDSFDADSLEPVWQWNHIRQRAHGPSARRPGFLRLHALPAGNLSLARNTLTQKLWDDFGTIEVQLETEGLAEGDRAGLAFISGAVFNWIGAEKTTEGCRVRSSVGPCGKLWLRGEYRLGAAGLLFSRDGRSWFDSGLGITLEAGFGKGARFGVFCFGSGGGYVDVAGVIYRYHSGGD